MANTANPESLEELSFLPERELLTIKGYEDDDAYEDNWYDDYDDDAYFQQDPYDEGMYIDDEYDLIDPDREIDLPWEEDEGGS